MYTVWVNDGWYGESTAYKTFEEAEKAYQEEVENAEEGMVVSLVEMDAAGDEEWIAEYSDGIEHWNEN